VHTYLLLFHLPQTAVLLSRVCVREFDSELFSFSCLPGIEYAA
jgi:hypothetical protein